MATNNPSLVLKTVLQDISSLGSVVKKSKALQKIEVDFEDGARAKRLIAKTVKLVAKVKEEAKKIDDYFYNNFKVLDQILNRICDTNNSRAEPVQGSDNDKIDDIRKKDVEEINVSYHQEVDKNKCSSDVFNENVENNIISDKSAEGNKDLSDLHNKAVEKTDESSCQEVKKNKFTEEKDFSDVRNKDVEDNNVSCSQEKNKDLSDLHNKDVEETNETGHQEVRKNKSTEKNKDLSDLHNKDVEETNESSHPEVRKTKSTEEINFSDVENNVSCNQDKNKDLSDLHNKDVEETNESSLQEVRKHKSTEEKDFGDVENNVSCNQDKNKDLSDLHNKDVEETNESGLQEVRKHKSTEEKDFGDVENNVSCNQDKNKDLSDLHNKDVEETNESGHQEVRRDKSIEEKDFSDVENNDVDENNVSCNQDKNKDLSDLQNKDVEETNKSGHQEVRKNKSTEEKDIRDVENNDVDENNVSCNQNKNKDLSDLHNEDVEETNESGLQEVGKNKSTEEKDFSDVENNVSCNQDKNKDLSDLDNKDVEETNESGRQKVRKNKSREEKDFSDVENKDGEDEVDGNNSSEQKEDLSKKKSFVPKDIGSSSQSNGDHARKDKQSDANVGDDSKKLAQPKVFLKCVDFQKLMNPDLSVPSTKKPSKWTKKNKKVSISNVVVIISDSDNENSEKPNKKSMKVKPDHKSNSTNQRAKNGNTSKTENEICKPKISKKQKLNDKNTLIEKVLSDSNSSINSCDDSEEKPKENPRRKVKRKQKEKAERLALDPKKDKKFSYKAYVPLQRILCEKMKDIYLNNLEVNKIKSLSGAEMKRLYNNAATAALHTAEMNETLYAILGSLTNLKSLKRSHKNKMTKVQKEHSSSDSETLKPKAKKPKVTKGAPSSFSDSSTDDVAASKSDKMDTETLIDSTDKSDDIEHEIAKKLLNNIGSGFEESSKESDADEDEDLKKKGSKKQKNEKKAEESTKKSTKADSDSENENKEKKSSTKLSCGSYSEGSSDNDKKEGNKRKRKRHNNKLLTISILDSDSDSEVVRKKKEKARKEKTMLTKKKFRGIIDSDSESDVGIQKRKVRNSNSSSQSSSSSSAKQSSSEDEKQKKKSRSRIKRNVSSTEEDEDNKGKDKSTRKSIRRLIAHESLAEETKRAEMEERERKARIVERQKKYNAMFAVDQPIDANVDKLVLDFNEETKEEILSVNKELVEKLKPHQAKGVQFMWDACYESVERIKSTRGSGCILAHCMGLGKTLQVIALVHTLMFYRKLTKTRKVLVVCPVNTVLNWVSEIEKWLENVDYSENIVIYDLVSSKQNTDRKFTVERWATKGGILIIGYDMFRNLTNPMNKRLKKPQREIFQHGLVDPGPDLVICDEGHLLKNERSNLSIAMNRIKTPRRIILTGTPMQNNMKEYYCMVQFVKPNLLGTYKEYINRFVNPITNGQYTDSTQHDIDIMRKRSHVLHKLLDGVVQRKDYSVLTPYLPPKYEYVLFLTLTEVQIKLYKHYLTEYSRKPSEDTKMRTSFLFVDFQEFQRICTHPRVLLIKSKEVQRKKLFQDDDDESEGSLKDFIDDDGSSAKSTSSSSSSSSSSDENESGDHDKNKSKKPKDDKAPRGRLTRNRAAEEGIVVENVIEDIQTNQEWWNQFCSDDELENIALSSKLYLLFKILQECELIGDKLLVFSQSLYSLTIIEYFLAKIDEATQKDETACGFSGSWALGLDYFRLDGSSSCDNRSAWCQSFNSPDNIRARLFLISTRAGGLGINLVGANRVIIFDVSWNPSHDIQSIYRVYRFGQTKPCYIYRFVTNGTMEMKIYERQVIKQAISKRVIDEQQIDRHYNQNDLAELYNFDPKPPNQPIPLVPKDVLLAELLQSEKDRIFRYHEHQSLLENKEDEELDEAERKVAWEEFENEKMAKINTNLAANNSNAGGWIGHLPLPSVTMALTNIIQRDNPSWPAQQVQTIIPIVVQQMRTQIEQGITGLFQRVDNEIKQIQLVQQKKIQEYYAQQQQMRLLQQLTMQQQQLQQLHNRRPINSGEVISLLNDSSDISSSTININD